MLVRNTRFANSEYSALTGCRSRPNAKLASGVRVRFPTCEIIAAAGKAHCECFSFNKHLRGGAARAMDRKRGSSVSIHATSVAGRNTLFRHIERRPPVSAVLASIAALLLVSAWLPPVWSADLPWSDPQQLVLVTTPDWDSSQGTLRTFVRTKEGWKEAHAAVPVVIGRAGAAWGVGLHPPQPGPRKREGDGRSPAGVFAIGTAFGYADSASTALPYAPMDANDWCIDVSTSPLYNRIVDATEVGVDAIAGSTEPMRRDLHVDGDQRYKFGFVIEHNPAGEPDAGSCIFAHVWKSADMPTAGCTAMTASAMRELLSWLRPDADPVFVLLPLAEYARLRNIWSLPAIVPAD